MATTTRRAWWSPIALVVAVGALGAVIGFAPLRSFDYGWHLRTGGLIAAAGAVPRVDPYTYTVPDARWIDMHWTFQLALHSLYQLGGHQAVRIGKGVCVLALLAVLGAVGWRRSRAAVSALALGGMLVASADRLIERPELVSFLLLAILLALLHRHGERRDRWVFAIIPVQLLWANLHGLFFVGIAVCAMALATELLRPLVRRDEPIRRDIARDLAIVTALAFLVSFVNPNGIDAVRFPLDQFHMIAPAGQRSDLGQSIKELRPILEVPGGVLKLVTAAGLALAAMALNWRRIRLFDAALFVAFLFLSLEAQRNAALLAIASVPIAVRNLGDFIDRHPPPRWAPTATAVVVLGLLSLATASRVRSQGGIWSADPLLGDRFPEAAADWILRERPDGPIYHAMADGGYLIWRLYPEYRVMVDGRLEVFGTAHFARLKVAASGRPTGFHQLDQEYHFGVALLHHRFFPGLEMLQWLHQSPEWRLVQLDEVASVFVRVGNDPPRWPEIGAGGSDVLAPLVDGRNSERDLRRRVVRFALLRALGRPERARELARDTCRRYRDRSTPPFVCGDGVHGDAPQRPGREHPRKQPSTGSEGI